MESIGGTEAKPVVLAAAACVIPCSRRVPPKFSLGARVTNRWVKRLIGDTQRAMRRSYTFARIAQPANSNPSEASQLPATRSAIRSQRSRSGTINDAARAMITNTVAQSPNNPGILLPQHRHRSCGFF